MSVMTSEKYDIQISTSPDDVEALLEKEYLLTNQRGSYVSSTIIGCNTRRYHGLLVASLQPPVQRFVTLADMLETVKYNDQAYELANFEFSDRLHPEGYRHLRSFCLDIGAHFHYELPDLSIRKSIYLDHEQDILVIDYDIQASRPTQGSLTIMPMLAMRDFHSLQSSSAGLSLQNNEQNVFTAHSLDPNGPAVHFHCPSAAFRRAGDWWYAMHYRKETQRGQHDYEDVWAPGFYRIDFQSPGRITLLVQATPAMERPGLHHVDPDQIITSLQARQNELLSLARPSDDTDRILTNAADQFIVRRDIDPSHSSTSIHAGFHWFADWGRDTFVSLPGLLLCTGRYDQAKQVIMTFGSAMDGGQIPNRFDDYQGPAHYNSVDASLWFINAAYQYLLATDDHETFQNDFRPVISEIIHAYQNGTRDNIHADTDGLIIAGDADTQLTWMDARCNGVSFTPRFGKAVEINALWINALHILAQTASSPAEKRENMTTAQNAQEQFSKLFWNPQTMALYDCIFPDGRTDPAIRPNQIFAVSLPFSPLNADQQKAVVQCVHKHLLTPYGLRSLSPEDHQYRPSYQGDQFQRDSAYHQGTVWGYLIGPFIEAYLKIHDHSEQAKEDAGKMIQPLLEHLTTDACLGSISEIFDGDYPHRPKGCIAQAWSVAEIIRAKHLISRSA